MAEQSNTNRSSTSRRYARGVGGWLRNHGCDIEWQACFNQPNKRITTMAIDNPTYLTRSLVSDFAIWRKVQMTPLHSQSMCSEAGFIDICRLFPVAFRIGMMEGVWGHFDCAICTFDELFNYILYYDLALTVFRQNAWPCDDLRKPVSFVVVRLFVTK